MNPRIDKRAFLRRLLAAASLAAWAASTAVAQPAPAAQPAPTAQRPWQSLPPTPALPDTPRQGWTELNGIKLWHAQYAAASGEGRPGTPVLLLHGGFASSNYYGHLVPALVAQGHEVLVVDSRGQGRSTAGSVPFSYRLLASDIAALLKTLGIEAVDIVGWSDGGIIGLELAMRQPQLVRRVFAFGANVRLDGLKPNIEKSPVFAEYLARTQQEYAALSLTPEAFDATSRRILHMWSHEPHYSRAELARITAPVTVADGQYDEALRPEHQVFIAKSIRDANLVMLPNVSHFAMIQNPAQFNEAVLAFLKYR